MKKHIEITVNQIDWSKNIVKFCITKQSHRSVNFGNFTKFRKNDSFMALNGVELRSDCWPSSFFGDLLNVRGKNKDQDSNELTVDISVFAKILQAIAEYNTYEFLDVEPEKHKIVIDGKEIEISDESFKALKESLK